MTSFGLFQTKRVVDNNFKLDEKGGKFSKWKENTVGKKRNFSVSHCVFKRLVLQTHKNQGLFGKGLTHSHTMTPVDAPGKQAF